MKKTSLALALCLAVAPARSQSQDFTGFIEGLCAGVILGLGTGILIVVGYRCITRPKDIAQYPDSIPIWTLPPEVPPDTNAPPATNVTKLLLKSGEALPLYDISSLQVMDRNGGCFFTNVFATKIQVSEDGFTWTTLYRLYGWISERGRLAVGAQEDWTPICTNYVFGTTNSLNLPVATGTKGYFRLIAP